jgi:hypothetical protein
VTDEENDGLTKPFPEEEIREALFQMEKTRLLGQMAFQLNSFKLAGTL